MKISEAATRVARRLLEGGPATATQLAAELDLTPAAVRRHLDVLEAAGYISVSFEAPFGPRASGPRGRGRPAKVCAITAAGRDAFETVYDDIAIGALRFLAARGEGHLVAEYAQSRARAFEERYAAQLALVPAQQRAQRLAELLSADGFAASVREAPTGLQICEHHCPMAHVAAEFPEFCEAEQAAFTRLLGAHTVRLSTMSSGADICTTHVPKGVPA